MPRYLVLALGSLLACAVLLAACGSGNRSSVTLHRGTGDATVTVVDEVGLVKSVEAGASEQPAPLPAPPAAWNPNGDLTSVAVSWESNACSSQTTLTLTGNALDLAIEDGPASACGADGLVRQVITLHLNRVIDPSAMVIHMVGQRPE